MRKDLNTWKMKEEWAEEKKKMKTPHNLPLNTETMGNGEKE